MTLAPGQSKPVTLTVSTPSTPGDAAGAIVLNQSGGPGFGRQSTIPVTLRSLIPSGSQSFTQTLTGGNGREFYAGQEFFYQLNVPAGTRELNGSIDLANNPNNPFTAFLINPNGSAQAQASNELVRREPGDQRDGRPAARAVAQRRGRGRWRSRSRRRSRVRR